MKTVKVLAFTSLFWLCACEKTEPELAVFKEQMFVMGTIIDVSIYGESEKKSQKMFHDLLKDFKYMQASWSPTRKGGLRRLNGLIALESPFTIGPGIKDMIEHSTQLSLQSEGLFNPALGKLIKLWKFSQEELPKGPPPAADAINKILAGNPKMTDLVITGLILESRTPDLAVDFGAYAKGYGVDKAIEYLKSQGVHNAIINAGGDLRAIGSKGKDAWHIGIRHPRENWAIASIKIQADESVFTSGDYERFYEYEGKRYHHIIDPRTGYPADQSTSVTVLHHNAAIADAAATALFVAGPKDWQRIAKKMSVTHVMLIDKNGKIFLTPEMQERLQFTQPESLDITVVSH